MDAGSLLRKARNHAHLTQGVLAARSCTSQATISAYESGRKQPSVSTLNRLLAAAGARLAIEPASRPVVQVCDEEMARRGRQLAEVLELADALPSEHEPTLRYPSLRSLAAAADDSR